MCRESPPLKDKVRLASCACLPGRTSLTKHTGKEFYGKGHSRPLSVAFTPLSPVLLLWSFPALCHQDLKANRASGLSADLLRPKTRMEGAAKFLPLRGKN